MLSVRPEHFHKYGSMTSMTLLLFGAYSCTTTVSWVTLFTATLPCLKLFTRTHNSMYRLFAYAYYAYIVVQQVVKTWLFFPSGEILSKWQLCLNENIVSCIFWSLLCLLNRRSQTLIESLYLAELGLLWSFGGRRHIIARSLLVKGLCSVSAANVLKSFLYKIIFWSTVWFSWKSAFSFLRKIKTT